MQAHVLVQAPDGRVIRLGHGDQIGRLRSSALAIDDVRVSEAHALVSLRGSTFRLLALRGLFAVDGKPLRSLDLQAGQVVSLAKGLEIVIEEVVLPDEVPALVGEGLPRQALSSVNSLVVGARVELLPKYSAGADAYLWSDGAAWTLRDGSGDRAIEVGDGFIVGERAFQVVALPLSSVGAGATRAAGGVSAPLRIVAQFDTVHIHRTGYPSVALSGIGARIISELVACDGPVPWEVLADLIWRDAGGADLRGRWDVSLARLRRKLDEFDLRRDLVRSDGAGHLELFLTEHDEIEDRT